MFVHGRDIVGPDRFVGILLLTTDVRTETGIRPRRRKIRRVQAVCTAAHDVISRAPSGFVAISFTKSGFSDDERRVH